MPDLIDLPSYMELDERGGLQHQFAGYALGQALDNWLRATPTTALFAAGNAGVVHFYVHKPLTPEYADKFRRALIKGLTTGFDPPLEIVELQVIADKDNRQWKIYGEVFSPYYNVGTELNYTLDQG
jgi:hypothetical protein